YVDNSMTALKVDFGQCHLTIEPWLAVNRHTFADVVGLPCCGHKKVEVLYCVFRCCIEPNGHVADRVALSLKRPINLPERFCIVDSGWEIERITTEVPHLGCSDVVRQITWLQQA